MRRLLTIASVFSCLAMTEIAAEPAQKPDQVEVKFKFEPGRSTRLKVVTKSVGTMKLPGPIPEQKFSQTFEQVLTSTCRKINPDKTVVMDMTMSDLAMHMSIGGFTLDYDSKTYDPAKATGPTAFVGKMFSAMNGATFTLTLSEDGRPLKVQGLTESIKKAMDQLGDDKELAPVKKMFDQLSSFIGDSTMDDQMQTFYRMSPPKKGPIKIGEKWEQTWSMRQLPMMAGAMQGKGEYQLVGIEELNGRKCEKVKVKESFSMLPPDKQPDAKPMAGLPGLEGILGRMKMEMSSSGGDGEAYIDYERGELVHLRQTQRLTISISMAADPSDPNEETRRGMPTMVQKIFNSVRVDLMDDAGGASAEPAVKETAKSAGDVTR